MSEIIIERNKRKYFFFLISIILLILFLFYIGFLWLSNPYKYVFWMLPNIVFVILFSITTILSAIILSYIVLKSLLNKEFVIKVRKEGLYVGILQYSNKLIDWKDISRIGTIEIDGVKHIVIWIKNVEHYESKEKGIQKFLFKSRVRKYGSPFILNISALSGDFEDIKEIVITNWEKYNHNF